MLPTFVIGLREGLEAALIVGIIAAFLRKQGRRDLLRWVFLGVGVAVALCLAVGIALDVLSKNLPQAKQEGLETVIGALAVAMVTYMVVWMRRHSRELKGTLEGLAADAMGEGGGRAGRAMVLMAFLAVLREGFETVVFLLAAFNESGSGPAAATGAVLGILVAVGLGYGIYRGGVRLNLAKFFRATGLVLVLVAAGLVVNALHTAHEAGWLNRGQSATVDLSWLVRPGSVQSSLLTGMLGVQPRPVLIEVIGWLVYLIPVGCYVAWPPGRVVPRRLVLGLCGGLVVAGTVAAALLAGLAPSAAAPPALGDGRLQITPISSSDGSLVVATAPQSPAGGSALPVRDLSLARTGSALHDGLAADTYAVTVDGTTASTLPNSADAARIAALNGGRLPIGVQAGTFTTLPVRYTDHSTLTVWVEPRTGRLVDLSWQETVVMAVVSPRLGPITLARPAAGATLALAPTAAGSAASAARSAGADLDDRAAMRGGAWAAGVVAALALVAGLALLVRDRRREVRAVRDVTSTTPDPTLVHS